MSSETRWQTQGLMASRRWAKITTPSIQEPWSIITIRREQCFWPAEGGEDGRIYTKASKREEEETACWLLIKGTEMQEGRRLWRRGEANLMSEIGLRGGRRSQWKWMRVRQKETEGVIKAKWKYRAEMQTGLVRATKPWLRKLGMIKKSHSAWRNHRNNKKKKGEHHKIKKKKEKVRKEMGTQTERGRGIENPLKGEREREWKNGNPTKALGIAFCRARAFLPSSILPLCLPSPPFPLLSHTFSHLAQAVLNLGTLTLCQAWCNGRESCPAEPCGCLLRVPFYFRENSPTPSSWSSPAFGSHPCRKERGVMRGWVI